MKWVSDQPIGDLILGVRSLGDLHSTVAVTLTKLVTKESATPDHRYWDSLPDPKRGGVRSRPFHYGLERACIELSCANDHFGRNA